MAGRPDDARHSTVSNAIAPSSSNPRSRVRAYPSPQYVPMRRQQSGFPFPRMPIGSTPPAPTAQPAIKSIAQASNDASRSAPDLQSTYVRYPSLHRKANRTRAATQGGHGFERQPVEPSPVLSSQSLPPPPLPVASHARKAAGNPAQSATLGPPIAKTVSAPVAAPLRVTARQKPRLNVSPGVPAIDWTRLPGPALEGVLAHLRTTHLEERSRSCNTCYMRDLDALQRSCRAWAVAAQRAMYSNIAIVGNDSPSKLRRFQTRRGARLILLRRTLRKSRSIASLLTTLHVPDPIIPLYLVNGSPNPEYDEYLCLLASVVMCCPNLETFTGFQPFYNHTFDRLTHALSTRTKLKQHVWLIAENDDISERSQKQLPPGLLDHHQVYQFQQYHRNWINLETLMLCSPASLGVLEHDVLLGVLHDLPRLRNLCVSSFHAVDFNDITLMELPRLQSLRIEECVGVTDAGLARWAASPSSIAIERMALIHQNINSLATISKLFAGLERLKKFSIMQSDVTPTLPMDVVVFPPLFASRTVERIHWDLGHERFASDSQLNLDISIKDLGNYEYVTPNTHLALSILHHGFPALKSLRAPRDISPPGVLQSVCRPASNGNMLLPSDTYSTYNLEKPPKSNSLQVARVRAQNLINQSTDAKKDTHQAPVTSRTHLAPPKDQLKRPTSTPTSSNSSGTSTSTTSTNLTEPDLQAAEHLLRLTKQRRDRAPYQTVATKQNPDHSLSQLDLHLRHIVRGPVKVNEFSLPTFNGRVSIHISDTGQVFQPPVFDLLPDRPGRDANGGVAMWGELLKIRERLQATQSGSQENASGRVRDGCNGSWNKKAMSVSGTKKGMDSGTKSDREMWRHTERERMSRGKEVAVEDFF